MLSWIVGYRNPCDEELKTEDKTEDKTEEVAVIEGKKENIIVWKDYETELKKIKEELKQLKIESDERWNKRLSPVSDNTELQTRKKRKKNKNASGT